MKRLTDDELEARLRMLDKFSDIALKIAGVAWLFVLLRFLLNS